MRTNSKQVRQIIRQHITDCVLDLNENTFQSFDELKQYVRSEFERVSNNPYNVRKFPNQLNRFSDYLNGSPFNFFFYYADITDYLNSLGINPTGKEYSNEQSENLYHKLIYREIFS